MRTQKSMLQWCKQKYHEAHKEYRLDAMQFPSDEATIAAGLARQKVWCEVLYYLTESDEWLDDRGY
jgi:hypothetical protein